MQTDFHVNTRRPELSICFPGPTKVGPDMMQFITGLCQEIQAAHESGKLDRYIVSYQTHRFRVQFMGEDRFAARYIPESVPALRDLGLHQTVSQQLLSPKLRDEGGLILFSGATGSGKTTTASATLRSRLEQFGGYALAVEDPPEFNLGGFHGKGYCESMDATTKGYEDTLVDALRCFPGGEPAMLLYGEVRAAATASELLRVGIDGHLVISTIHSKDIATALSRLQSLAEKDGERNALRLMADSLKMIVHQKIISGPGERPVFQAKVLSVNGPEAAMIAEGNFRGLSERAERQMGMSPGGMR